MSNGTPGPTTAPPVETAIGTTTIDTRVAHSARRYDYWLGGKDNFPADRASGDAIEAAYPTIRIAARENRKFLRRAVSHLAGDAGIRQFLDLGTGLPTASNTHDVAQRIAPDARVVYVDKDPIVLAHARALLTGAPPGRTEYLQADLRDPGTILTHPATRDVLDFTQPIALLLVAILHFITDDADPVRLVRTYLDALPTGSYLVLSHATGDHLPPTDAHHLTGTASRGSADPFQFRTHDAIARFFDGLQLVEPGLVSVVDWRPDNAPADRPNAKDVSMWAGVALKR